MAEACDQARVRRVLKLMAVDLFLAAKNELRMQRRRDPRDAPLSRVEGSVVGTIAARRGLNLLRFHAA